MAKRRRRQPGAKPPKAVMKKLKALAVLEYAAEYGAGNWYDTYREQVLDGWRPRHPVTGRIMNASDTLAWAEGEFGNDEEVQEKASLALRELSKLAFSDIRCLFREDGTFKAPADLTDDEAAALSQVRVSTVKTKDAEGNETVHIQHHFDTYSKPDAIKTLLQAAGRLVNKTEHAGEGGGPVVVRLIQFGDEKPADD